ncbi:MAG: SHOCT domain-containing protein [Pseudogulbenkiania sp.]|nr:SHOCT domain-containing protein [Pseudogulbenkiania sp.]
MMGNWGEFGWWGMGLGVVFMILFWLLIILGVAALIRWLLSQSGRNQEARHKTPLEIVQERYARGEIDREEYEQKMRDLQS